jgi:hypothetical protein
MISAWGTRASWTSNAKKILFLMLLTREKYAAWPVAGSSHAPCGLCWGGSPLGNGGTAAGWYQPAAGPAAAGAVTHPPVFPGASNNQVNIKFQKKK